MIYTSYFSNIKKLTKSNLECVSISGKCPDWYNGEQFKKLAPKFWFFKHYKEFGDKNHYIEHYVKEVLSVLNVGEVYRMFDGKVLLCYEKEGFCHRHLVSKWFNKHGFECKEF